MAIKNKPLYENITPARKELVQKVLDMKLKQLASQLMCLDWLMRDSKGPLVDKPNAYEIMSYADDMIEEMNKASNHIKLERAIERMEQYIITLQGLKKWDLVMKAEDMLNKLRGNYVNNINVSGSIDQKVQTIRLNIPDDTGDITIKGNKDKGSNDFDWFDSKD